jgi:hypothetical protein
MVRSACIILINSGFPRLVSLFCTVGLGTNDMAELELLSVVALTEDLLTKRFRRGQVGTIIEALAPDIYEVEFSDDQGQPHAMVPVRCSCLMRLFHEPRHDAA